MTTNSDPTLILRGRDVASIVIHPEDVPVAPRGRGPRLARALAEALPTLIARHDEAASQSDAEPIMLVIAVDCALGRELTDRLFSPAVAPAVSGPLVVAVAPEIFPKLFGAMAPKLEQELKALNPGPGEITVAFAVNARGIDLRALGPAQEVLAAAAPAPPASAPEAPPVEQGFPAEDAAAEAPPAEDAAAA